MPSRTFRYRTGKALKRTIPFGCVIAVFLHSAFGATLTIDGFVRSTFGGTAYPGAPGIPLSRPIATAADFLRATDGVAYSDATRASEAYFDAYASFGRLGLRLGGSASCSFSPCGEEVAEGYMNVFAQDMLFINGATDGYIKLDVLWEGSFRYAGAVDYVQSEGKNILD